MTDFAGYTLQFQITRKLKVLCEEKCGSRSQGGEGVRKGKKKKKRVPVYLNIRISSNFLFPDEFCRHEHFEIMDVRQ